MLLVAERAVVRLDGRVRVGESGNVVGLEAAALASSGCGCAATRALSEPSGYPYRNHQALRTVWTYRGDGIDLLRVRCAQTNVGEGEPKQHGPSMSAESAEAGGAAVSVSVKAY